MRLEFFLVFVSPNIDCLALLFNLNRRAYEANGAFSGLQRTSPCAQSIKVCSGKRAYKPIDAPSSAVATQDSVDCENAGSVQRNDWSARWRVSYLSMTHQLMLKIVVSALFD